MNKMKKKGIFRRIALGAAALTMLVSAGSCGRSELEGRIAVICKNEKVEFWNQVKEGAEDACTELTLNFDYYCATSDNDYASQIDYINQAIRNKANAIVIAPNSTTELQEALKKASDAGIKIININSDSGFEGTVSTISSSDIDGGKVAASNAIQFIATLPEGQFQLSDAECERLKASKIGIVPHSAATAGDRVEGFKGRMVSLLAAYTGTADAEKNDAVGAQGGVNGSTSGTSEFRNMFVEPAEGYSTEEQAYEASKEMLNKNPGIVMMYATNTNTTLGVCKAVSELGLNDKVSVIGFNSDEQIINYIKTGTLDGVIIQNPYLMGFVGVTYANRSIGGENLPRTLDTGVTFVSQQNLNDEYIQLLLYPDKD